MVKAVVGEETRLNLAEDRLSQSAIPAQVGLVIGKLSSSLDRGFVFDLVPTPLNDAGEPACFVTGIKDDKKKPTKSKSQSSDTASLVIDNEWVAEHARQVSRMLLGGIKVIGIYVWASDSAYKNSTMVLCQTLKAVADAAPLLDTDLDERLLIHICYSPRRWTCRNCSMTTNITSSSLRPCDFKMGRVLSSLQKYKCTYNFDLRFPICNESASNAQTFTAILRQGISVHAKQLRGAMAMVDGNLVLNDEPCATDGFHEVELLLPFMKDSHAEACSIKDIVGVLLFSGSVCSYAYLNTKEPISQAVTDIKGDIIKSLQSRLDIICDEVDEEVGQTDDGGKAGNDDTLTPKPASQLVLHLLRKPTSLSFPRRVFVPWLGETFICDYLQPSESLEVLKDHCVELMSMEALPDELTILETEVEAPSLVARSFWDVLHRSPSLNKSSIETTRAANSLEAKKPFNLNFVTAIFFLLLAIAVGCILYIRQ